MNKEFDAQPARQMGGDDDYLHGHPRHEHDSRDEIELFLRDAYAAGANAAHSRSLTTALDYAARHAPKLRAALAPAAVVMPDAFTVALKIREAMDRQACPDAWMRIAVEAAEKFIGEEFARLNRRAIPAGLLEKLAHCTDPDCCIAFERGELRALLGKDGEA